jgi:hypothetical protein
LLGAVALDDVARLGGVGQDDALVPDGAARRLYLSNRPDAFSLARPEREAGSVGAVEDISAADPGRDRNLLPSALA